MSRSTRFRRVRWYAVAVLGFFAVIGLVAGVRLAGIERDLREARRLLLTAGDQIEAGDLATARAGLAKAEDLLVRSNNSLYNSPDLDLIRLVPGISQNVTSLRRTVSLALDLVSGGGRILDQAVPLEDANGKLEVPLRSGAIPLDVVKAVQLETLDLSRALPGRDERPDRNLLIGPIADAQDELFDQAVRRRDQLAAVGQGLTLLTEMAGGNGPRRYLIAVANTAEMRGSGGMYLSYGVLEGADGDFELPAFGRIDELFLDKGIDPDDLEVPDDEARRWAGLEPTRLWRNVNLVPDVAVVLPRVQAMYEAATGDVIDGVIQIDAHGLAAVLEGIGPVQVDGVGQVTSENAVDLTLNQAYTRFPDRDQRQEVLGDVAEETFRRLVDGEYSSLRTLGEAVARAANERHIIVRSEHDALADPAAWFHGDGQLPDAAAVDHAFLTVQNFARNKLDYYLDTSVAISGSRPAGKAGEVDVEVRLANTAPAEVTSTYVYGDPAFSEPGVYVGTVSLYLPSGTTFADEDDGDAPGGPRLVSEDGRALLTFDVSIRPGGEATETIRLRFPPRPDGFYRFELVPIPRVRPTNWSLDIDLGGGATVVRRPAPLLTPHVAASDAR